MQDALEFVSQPSMLGAGRRMRFEKICAVPVVPVLFPFVVRQYGLRLVEDLTSLIHVSAL